MKHIKRTKMPVPLFLFLLLIALPLAIIVSQQPQQIKNFAKMFSDIQIRPITDTSINIGDHYMKEGSISYNSGIKSWEATVDYGDGSGIQSLPLSHQQHQAESTFTLDHTYSSPGIYTVMITVATRTGETSIASTKVLVNGPPQLNLIPDTSTVEGSIYELNTFLIDDDGVSTAWTVTADYGDGEGAQPISTSDKNFTLNHLYKDNGTYTITITATDNGGLSTTTTTRVTVTNAPPSIGTITVPTSPTKVGTPITASATLTDPGIFDTHTAVWDWGDGTTSPGTINETNGSGSVSNTHTYLITDTSAIKTYTITLTITDKDGGVTTKTSQAVPIYKDTSEISGGIHYFSGIGAYFPNTRSVGTVRVTVTAKNTPGKSTPDGEIYILSDAGPFWYRSTSLSSLETSAGSKAVLQGTGYFNGGGQVCSPSCPFIFTIQNSYIPGVPAKVRLQITNGVGSTLYDNQKTSPITAEPTTQTTTGSIVFK